MFELGLKSMAFLALLTLTSPVSASDRLSRDVKLNIGGESIEATWYQTTNIPAGFVHLQHGFSRNRKNLHHLAEIFQDQGFVVLTTTLGRSLSRNSDFATAMVDYLLTLNLPDRKIMVGHSLGAVFSILTAEAFMNRGESPSGVLMLDLVPNPIVINPALKAIDGKIPMLSIITQPSLCNSRNSALATIDSLSGNFKGFQLPTGTHCDPEGNSSDLICAIGCGRSDVSNVTVMFDFSTRWILDWVGGSKTPSYYPGGAEYESQISSGRITEI